MRIFNDNRNFNSIQTILNSKQKLYLCFFLQDAYVVLDRIVAILILALVKVFYFSYISASSSF